MINAIPNQAINFSPSDVLECKVFGMGYCQYINGNESVSVQMQLDEVSGTDISDGLTRVATGTNTSTGASVLIDSGADFVADGVVPNGATAFNASNFNSALVSTVSTTSLALSSNIFPSSPVGYFVINVALGAPYIYPNIGDNITLLTGGSMSTGEILTNGALYRVDIDIVSNSGEIEIGGANPLGGTTTTGTGVQSFYIRANILKAFSITQNSGVSQISDLSVYQIDEPTLKIYDLDFNLIYTGQPGLEIWDNTAMLTFELLDLPDVVVGCYTFKIAGVLGELLATDCIKIGSNQPCDVIKLTWTNNNNAFGIDYVNLNYTQSFWVRGTFNNPTYSMSNKVLDLSNGGTYLLTSQRKKQWQLQLMEMPSYMHDALSVGLLHREFYVNGVQYRFDGEEYSPVWRNTSKNAPVILELRAATENNRNNNC